MKAAGTLVTLAIVGFWLAMNTTLLIKEHRRSEAGRQLRGVDAYLAGKIRRERWLSIFRKTDGHQKKIGYSGYTIEKEFTEEGIAYHVTLDLVMRGFAPKLGFIPDEIREQSELRILGTAELDSELRPLQLHIQIQLGLHSIKDSSARQMFFLKGRRDDTGEKIMLSLIGGDAELFRYAVPLDDIAISDGLSPVLPVGDFAVGETHEVRVLNPLSSLGLSEDSAKIKVVEERTERVDGTLMDILVVETTWNHTTTRAWTTKDGEVLRQEIGPPLNLILRNRFEREHAIRGFEP